MNLLQIRYFISVAENMSFTRASQDLYVSQPTISKQIASLEEELGVTLFYRNGKAITVSPAGELLYNEFVRILREIDSAALRARSLGVGLFGELKLGYLQFTDLRQIVPGLVRDFVLQNPNIRLEMQVMPRKELQHAILDETIDCGFLLSFEAEEIAMSASVSCLPLPTLPHRLIYPRSLRFDKPRGELTIRDFAEENFIFLASPEGDTRLNRAALTLLDEVDLTPKRIYWVDSAETMLLYVEEGLGVAVVGPASRVRESELVCTLDLPDNRRLAGFSFCWKRTSTNPALPLFVDQLRTTLHSVARSGGIK